MKTKRNHPVELERLWTWRDVWWNCNKFKDDPTYLYGTRREDGFYNKKRKHKSKPVCKSLVLY